MKKQKSIWEQNQEKAEAMTVKFIAALKRYDCYVDWAAIMIEKIVENKRGNKECTGDIISTLETEFGFRTIVLDNLAQEIRFDEFERSISANPCQLQLIA